MLNIQKTVKEMINSNEEAKTTKEEREVCAKILAYIKATYKEPALQISMAQIKQLAWVMNNPLKTNEMSVQAGSAVMNELHIEIKRAASRLYCLQLLKKGGRAAHDKFIEAQVEARKTDPSSPDPLSFQHFQLLSGRIQLLNDAAFRALTTSTIVSSVTLSPAAKQLAKQAIGTYPEDSVEFLATTVEKAIDIYPLVETLTDEEQNWFRFAFPHHTHFRHMMYTEGGQGMFEVIRQKIQSKVMTYDELEFWYCHWMINITGFRGHVNPKGSLYLTEVTFHDMELLKIQLDGLMKNSKHDALSAYLKKRAEALMITTTEHDNLLVLVLGHLGAMLRLHTSEEGRALLQGYSEIDENIRKEIKEQYFLSLTQPEVTPTYVPALFANVLAKTKDIKTTVKVCLPFYTKAYAAYRTLVSQNKIDKSVALNFNEASSPDNIAKLLAMTSNQMAEPQINILTGAIKFEVKSVAPTLPTGTAITGISVVAGPTWTPLAAVEQGAGPSTDKKNPGKNEIVERVDLGLGAPTTQAPVGKDTVSKAATKK